jgi:dTDP-4-amino-4,6-dideoxygalactose transaminase
MGHNLIQYVDLAANFRAHADHIRVAVERVLQSGWYILGREVTAFEEEFAAYCDVGFGVGVASGTDAVALALKGCGVQPGDEVVTVSHTAVATVAAIEQIGAVPVFVDIDPLTRCMQPDLIASLISEKTRAIVPVHIYGQPSDMPKIMQIAQTHGLKVVEDCAQAHGAEIAGRKVGSFGDAAAFSFYPTKNLGALGDGGAIVTSTPDIYHRCRALREYGWEKRYISSVAGVNSRLDELQAAVLRVKLSCLDVENMRRREIAASYSQALQSRGITPPATIPGTEHAMHLYVVECEQRERFEQYLKMAGVATVRHYPLAVHQQPAYSGRIRGSMALPVTEHLYQRIVSLPMYPHLSNEQVEYICRLLVSFSAGC